MIKKNCIPNKRNVRKYDLIQTFFLFIKPIRVKCFKVLSLYWQNVSLSFIEQCEAHEQFKERETFWQHRLKTFYPYGFNEKKECLY